MNGGSSVLSLCIVPLLDFLPQLRLRYGWDLVESMDLYITFKSMVACCLWVVCIYKRYLVNEYEEYDLRELH